MLLMQKTRSTGFCGCRSRPCNVGIPVSIPGLQDLKIFSLQAGLLPLMFPDIELNSKEPFTLTSFALSLLLVSGFPHHQPVHLLENDKS